ncbi:MAG: hypothetical protein Q7T81_02250 [Pseudolabrys sp.]|nr:hypothetical protein [Pseudolabrys sp.]
MSKRQFANLSITQLEKLFDEKRDKIDVLTSLLAELNNRKMPRARDLKRRVAQAIAVGKYDEATQRILKPASPEDFRFAAEYLLKGQSDWTIEERTESASIARHLINLAGLIEKRIGRQP